MTQEHFPIIPARPEVARSKEEIFAELFPTGKIQEVLREDIPEPVLHYFESMSERFVDPKMYREGKFQVYYIIDHTDIPGMQTFVGDQEKTYDDKGGQIFEKNVYFYDSLNGQEVGHGELRYQPESQRPFYQQKPFVGSTATEENFQRSGYGRKRLLMMGAYSQMQWNLPLYSGDQNEIADEVWQDLIQKHLAEEVQSDNPLRKRYRLKQNKISRT